MGGGIAEAQKFIASVAQKGGRRRKSQRKSQRKSKRYGKSKSKSKRHGKSKRHSRRRQRGGEASPAVPPPAMPTPAPAATPAAATPAVPATTGGDKAGVFTVPPTSSTASTTGASGAASTGIRDLLQNFKMGGGRRHKKRSHRMRGGSSKLPVLSPASSN